MKIYDVEVSYTYDIEAKNEEEAEKIANDWYCDDPPRGDEVNYKVTLNKEQYDKKRN